MFRNYSGSFLAVLIRMTASLAINKLFAMYFGGTGITLLAHLQNLLGMTTLISTDGIQRGLTKYLSDENSDAETKKHFLGAGLVWILSVFVGASLLVSRFDTVFLNPFIGDRHPVVSYLVFMSALLGQLLYLTGASLLLVLQKLNEYVVATLYAGLLSVLAVSLTAIAGNLQIALLAFVVGQAISVLAVAAIFFRLRNQLPAWMQGSFSFSAGAFGALGSFALVALSVLVFGKAVDFWVRGLAIRQFGAEATGLWQAMVKLSGSYNQVFVAMLGIVFFPQLSEKISDFRASLHLVRQNLLFWLPVLLAGLTTVYFLRKYLLTWLFSAEFEAAGELTMPQLIGDFFHLSSYFLAYRLLAAARLVAFVVLQALSAGIYVGSILLLLPYLGITTFPAAYAIQSLSYALLLTALLGYEIKKQKPFSV